MIAGRDLPRLRGPPAGERPRRGSALGACCRLGAALSAGSAGEFGLGEATGSRRALGPGDGAVAPDDPAAGPGRCDRAGPPRPAPRRPPDDARLIRPASPEMPDLRASRRATSSSARSPAAAWASSSRAATSTSAATWPSRCSARSTATTPRWSAGSSRRPRSAASSSTRASSRSTSWAGFPDGRPYIAMKLVQGRTLAALLAARTGPGRGPAAVPRRSSSRSARRWPTPTPGA